LVAMQPIVLVSEPGTELEAKNRIARIGFDNVVGHLSDPAATFLDHPQWVTVAARLTVAELADRLDAGEPTQLVDVRGPGEVTAGTIDGALTVPLPRILDRLVELDPEAPTVVYCASGYRSMIAASVMRSAGFTDVSDLVGGYGAWEIARPAAGALGS
nr:rhodanese-like domain-containing protein [Acidimicrobiia bacterium]